MTIRGDFFLTVYHAPYFIAADRGWYAEEGLEVEFFEGQGSSSTVQLVAAGEDDFGFAASEAVISAVSQGAPVKMVANIFDDSGLCTMVKADFGDHRSEGHRRKGVRRSSVRLVRDSLSGLGSGCRHRSRDR